MPSITINGVSINPSAPQPQLAALALDNANAKASDYILVQTKVPLDKAQRAQLEKAGAEILEAVPGSAFVCHFPKTSLAKVRALPFVEWADLYPEVVKIAPALRNIDTVAGGVPATADMMPQAASASLDRSPVTVDVVLHRNVNAKQAAKRVAEAAHVAPDQVTVAGSKVRVSVKKRRLADLAALDDVRHVEQVYPAKLSNNIARDIMRVPGVVQGSDEAKGEIVAVADTGFDKGSTSDVHPAFAGRVKKLYALGRPGLRNDPDGHGTHVAGSVLGDGVSSADGPIRGTAPQARLVLQSVLDAGGGLGGLPDNLADLFKKPYQTDGARVHTNSWGSTGNFGMYDQQAFELDEFVYKNRDLLVCFSAGNEGVDVDRSGQIDPSSVTPPGTAKNCLTIGASENRRPQIDTTYVDGWPNDYTADPIRSDKVADNPEGMVAFSGRGPTSDGRIKPDVVAPGSFILSTRSRATQSRGWGLTDDPLYFFEGGTSMATPLVAGCAASVRAFLRNKKGVNKPSAALIKALLINGARDIAGQYVPSEAGSTPNNSEGFGRIDLQAVIGPWAANETLQFKDEGAKLDTGQRADITITLAAAGNLKATLVWTDPPGEGLQSDLDLIVKVGNVERHGNMPANSQQFDRKNNVEQVMWSQVPAGTVTVSVVAFSIAVAPQNYALVVRTS